MHQKNWHHHYRHQHHQQCKHHLNVVNSALSAASSFLVLSGIKGSISSARGALVTATDVNRLLRAFEEGGARAACSCERSDVHRDAAWASAAVEVTLGRALM